MRATFGNVMLLSDLEVLQVANDLAAKYRVDAGEAADQGPVADGVVVPLKSPIQHLNTVHYELMSYLHATHAPRPCIRQTPAGVRAFLAALRDAGLSPPSMRRDAGQDEVYLTRTERLMLVNHAPTTQVFLSTLVEECFIRFTPEQIQLILSLVQEHLLPPPAAEEPAPGYTADAAMDAEATVPGSGLEANGHSAVHSLNDDELFNT